MQTILPYQLYAAGLAKGFYMPKLPRPQYGKSKYEILADIYMVEIAKKVAEKAFMNPEIEKAMWSIIQIGLKRMQNRQFNDTVEDSLFGGLSSYFGH
jgi:hypothetical protein